MAAIDVLLSAINERAIAQQVGIEHDQARATYRNYSVVVDNYGEFERIITEYYQYHYSRCVARGGRLDDSQASSSAKDIISEEYRRKHNGDVNSAFDDAKHGTNGGMRFVLDVIANGLKMQAVENYICSVFDRVVTPVQWHDKVEIIRQFIDCCGVHLHDSIDRNTPERYAQNYSELIRAYVDNLEPVSSMFRRL